MDKRVPPPLPVKGEGNLPQGPKKPTLEADPNHPAPQKPVESSKQDIMDIDYEVKRKTNPWLWIVPGIIILLLAGGGVYAYYYVKKQDEQHRKELQEEKEEEEARQKAIADSIAEAERIQTMNDSLRVNFRTPDLDLLGLKGHVMSVHTKASYCDGNFDILSMLLNETTIEYDYDGNFRNLGGNLDRYGENRPSISRDSDGKVREVSYNYEFGPETYTLSWNGDYLSSLRDYSSGSTWSQTNSGGSFSNPESASYTYNSSDNKARVSISFKYTYSDRDEYGNWRKATVTGTGTRIFETEEWDDYYMEWNSVTQRENLNYTYTIDRFINYYEYKSVE